MYQASEASPQRRGGFSLYVRVSLLLVFTAIFPLAITLIFSEWYTRPALIVQANITMQNDVRTRVQLIETYFQERQLDAQTLAQVPSAQTYMNEPFGTIDPEGQRHALYTLGAGSFRDKNYTNWSLFDTQGRLRLTYPQKPKPHGQSLVPTVYQQAVKVGKTVISDVYFDPQDKAETVDIYTPVFASPDSGIQPVKSYLGFVRATLKLDYIISIVKGDTENNGPGSYAFLLDANGVRIATGEADNYLKAVADITGNAAQQIKDEQRYGSTDPVPVLQDNELANRLHMGQNASSFQMQPAEKQEAYQVVEQRYTLLNWQYYVLSPVNTTTALANQQLFFTGLIVLVVGLIAILVGLIAARRIASPLITAMKFLRSNSQALSALAKRQQDAATEQMWVVDSSQMGLQSIQYYTEAIHVAAKSLDESGTALAKHWNRLDAERVRQALERIVSAAHYIENASNYQKGSNQKLETALKVTTQVTEQLASGATSATEAATQLEQVVEQLRGVVGR